MDPKECERALSRTLKSLGTDAGKSITRALVRRLDGRVSTLVSSFVESEFDVSELDVYARSEGVSTRRQGDSGPGALLARVRDALNVTSFARMVSLATAWDPSGGDPWMDVASAAQPTLFAWWQKTHDERSLCWIAATNDRVLAGPPRTGRAIARCVERANLDGALFFSEEVEANVALVSAALDEDRALSNRESASLRALLAQVERDLGWAQNLDEASQAARALTALISWAEGDRSDGDGLVAVLAALDARVVARDSSNARYFSAKPPRYRALECEQRLKLLREGCECPELARWVAACDRRPRG